MPRPSSLSRLALFASLVALTACRPGPDADPTDAVTPTETEATDAGRAEAIADAVVGVDDPQLRELLAEHWGSTLDHSPYYGAPGWGEYGPAGREAGRERRERWLAALDAIEATASLSERDAITAATFRAQLESSRAAEVCEYWSWSISLNTNPVEVINGAFGRAYLVDAAAGEAELERLRAYGPVVDSWIADLRDGLSRGRVADRETLERVAELLDSQLGTEAQGWGLFIEAGDKLEAQKAGWTAEERAAFELGLEAVIDGELRPGVDRFAALVRDELLPAARGPEAVGIGALPEGAACYEAMILRHLSEPRTAEDIHALGLQEIARIDAEFERLGASVFGEALVKEGGRAAVLERLRTDPALYFDSPEAVEAFAQDSLAAATAELPKWFNALPEAPCEVKRIPDYQAPFTYVGYYGPPTPDEAIGYYYVNTSKPTTRPRFQARALAVHEAVPGHHLQIALSLELDELPMVRRTAGVTVFVEGWALYTERLADEMGLYRDDLDRLGALSYEAWRASRLVVDTGMHSKGWTREQARAFMREHTALAETNIVNEVDRYVGWPGQALGYKYGQLEILKLRAEAEAALGDRFDIAAFHDQVLGAGAVSLPVLRRRVRAWVEAQGRG